MMTFAYTRGRGFTLVEIMIVVAIIGLVASMAIPAFLKARDDSRISAFANDLRLASAAFEIYAMDHGMYPDDAGRAVVPDGMDEYLPRMEWDQPTPLGGVWDWERNVFGISAGISAVDSDASVSLFQKVDKRVDDGNLSEGRFRIRGSRYTYTLEE